MNTDNCCRNTKFGVYAVGVLATLLIMGGLVWLMRYYTEAPPVFAQRSAERTQIYREYTEANVALTNSYDWADQTRGIIRIPLDKAMDLYFAEAQNAASGRSNMLARATKAFAPLPKAPEKKNEYE